MDERERAQQIFTAIQVALGDSPAVAGPAGGAAGFAVTREGGCLSCDPGACWECGHLFAGDRIVIRHAVKGERVLSDRALHLLSHGIVRYTTRYVVRGQPVIVDLDLDELAQYLDL